MRKTIWSSRFRVHSLDVLRLDAGVSECGWMLYALLTSALVSLICIVSGNHSIIGEMCGEGLNSCLETATSSWDATLDISFAGFLKSHIPQKVVS